ncbi:MAG: SUMF1/EgtB/PvdO family nonheme iron enzyme [Roseomonas sp.]|nr:SUMF1/EgtB/PvdO family nonheme iron enzyme [Roseomonas sp.]
MVSDGHIHVHPEKARISAVAFDRLPSEAEWEYACRAGTKTAFSFGATITTAQANFSSGGRKARRGTVAVGSLPVNGWGRHETHGNVCEWCEDGLGPYPDRPTRHPCRMGSARRRVCCAAVPGAAPHGTSAPPIALRSLPRSAAFTFGFRLARTPGGSPALRPAYSCLYPRGELQGGACSTLVAARGCLVVINEAQACVTITSFVAAVQIAAATRARSARRTPRCRPARSRRFGRMAHMSWS